MIIDVESARGLLNVVSLLLLLTAPASVLLRRLGDSIVLLAGQGALLAAAAAVVALATGTSHAYVAVAITVAIKVLAVPGILLLVLREVTIKKEVEAVISQRLALLLAIGLVLVAYYIAGPLAPQEGFVTGNSLPAAVSMLLIGLLNMLTRKKAISQVIGIVAMENGLYLMAVTATQGLPLAVELGVGIDLVVGVMVMGFVTREIHRTFNTINTDRLQTLRG
ncbi:MAG: hydrogenase [Chloroflexi bacterium]|nr:hydrogenase [Chloroflexota bacterium]